MDVLHTWLEGTHVGVFTRAADGHIGFDYDSPEGPVISLSLPRDGNWTKHAPQFFLDNLLPDNPAVRLWMQRVTGAASEQPFDLLAETGHDVAGGLVLSPAETFPAEETAGFQLADDDEIAYRIADLKRNPALWLDPQHRNRFSLAGAQAKFALAQVDDRWAWPSAVLPSTHIVKPASDKTPLADVIEAATMHLAAIVGLPAPPAGILQVLDQQAYIVQRFDRDFSVSPTRRIHTEDFAQALGRRPHDKYNIQANEIIALLRRATGNDDLAYQFIERLAFNTAIGNADAHAKNYSIMLRPSGIALAPVYDVLPTVYWNYVDDHLAMHIDGAKRSVEVTPAHWRKLARQTGLDEEQVQEIATTIVHKARNQAPRAYNDLPSDTAAELQQIIEHSTTGLIHAA